MPHRIIDAFAVAKPRAYFAQRLGRMPHTGAMASGLQPITLASRRLESLARSLTKAYSTRPSSITVWMSALSMATSVSALNCSVRQAWRPMSVDARVGQHDLRAALRSVLHPGRSHRVVGRGVGADHKDQLGMLHVVHRIAHRARAHAFEQRGHAGRMAQPRAVVHVVAAKAGAHQLLEQIGLFVAALGRAKARQRLGAVGVAQVFRACQRQGPAPRPRSLRGRYRASRHRRGAPPWAHRACGSAAPSGGRGWWA